MGTDGIKLENQEKHVHTPVLLAEVLDWLRCRPASAYLDGTVGQGGHAEAILAQSTPDGIVIGLDRDQQAVEVSRTRLQKWGPRVRLMHGHYRDLRRHVESVGIHRLDGVLFDLGISSAQLADSARGFSFQADGPLDMRMNSEDAATASDLVNRLPEQELADVLYQYGEERYARRIARAVVRRRKESPLVSTAELVDVIRSAVPASYRHGRIHCATRSFQALRIAVNRELDDLAGALSDATHLLSPGGRLCVISFHSLEDRIAKQTLRKLSSGDEPVLSVLTKKPVVASEAECRENLRARSAKLRVAERMVGGRAA